MTETNTPTVEKEVKQPKKKKAAHESLGLKYGLNPEQEKFCQLFASDKEFFGNGTQSYMEAYGNGKKKVGYMTAMANASRLLTKANILKRINELLELVLTDAHVDKQLLLVITQNSDFRAKVSAIDVFNKLKGRVTSKIEVTLPIPILSGHVHSNKSNKKDKGAR